MAQTQGQRFSENPQESLGERPTLVDLGSGFTGHFLWWLLGGFALVLAGALVLSWSLGMEVSVKGTGTLVPRSRWLVKTEVGGIVREIPVRQGQRVECGDLLVALEEEEWRAELRKIENDLVATEIQRQEIVQSMAHDQALRAGEVEAARLEVEMGRLQLERLQAELELSKGSLLLKSGWSRRPFEELVPVKQQLNALRQSQSELELAEKRLKAVAAREQELLALDQTRQKLLEDKRLLLYRLQRTNLRAPVAGIVLTEALERRIGDRVQAGETLIELVEEGGWQAEVVVSQRDIPKVKLGQPARLYLEAFPHMEYGIFSGTVEEIGAQPVAGDKGYKVKVAMGNPQVRDGEAVYALACGMSAEARILVEKGRIAALVWRRLLRSLGRVYRGTIYLQTGAPSP